LRKLRKNRKLSFEELVRENKLEILKNEEQLDKIERKIEERQLKKVE
jgi:Fur-regulated basic protein B